MPGPAGPKPKNSSKQASVYLPNEMWQELSEAAEFHTDVFKVMGVGEKVSRNDMIESFLAWAIKEYWEDKGGKPSSDKEWADKTKRHADVLRSDAQSGSKK